MSLNFNFEYLDEAIKISNLTSLVIENRNVFAKVVQGLYLYADNADYIKIFDDRYNMIKFSDLMVITDILGFDVNSAAILKLIYRDLESQISEKPDEKTQIDNLLQDVTNLVNAELLDFNIDLESDEITFPEVFKALGVQVEVTSDTIFERMLEIIQVYKYLSKKKLIIFINAASYLTSADVKSLEDQILFENVDVLMLDISIPAGISESYFLDEDYVLIKEKMV
ncbi:MAG: type II-A CRISPR-associated protein Csn2 [Bifidobacteriaceae bacterium]|jgi:CRISPR-associated protein Csn2|nr:type II-A CRISPR-associated protein Csn2 [Bifidobacteriaceae bacterium]